LLEIIVVLVILAIAAGVAAPALLPPRDPVRTGLAPLIPAAQEAAARRGETIRLRVGVSGDWRMEAASSAQDGPLTTGRVSPFAGLPLTLIVSPIGSCGFDGSSAAAAAAIPLDSMVCEIAR
jgi:hypothetical protein